MNPFSATSAGLRFLGRAVAPFLHSLASGIEAPHMSAAVKIAPSILSADFGSLAMEIKEVTAAGADYIHVDVMDGHFVPNLTIGPVVVEAVRRSTHLPLDVHLMITEPARYVDAFAHAGADIIGIHVEVEGDIAATLRRIVGLGKKASITLNPETEPEAIEHLLDEVDQVLIMSVHPGFGGQKFLPLVYAKIERLRSMVDTRGLTVDIEVDGGISEVNAARLVAAGANVLVAGAAIFGHQDRRARVELLRRAAAEGSRRA
jgi:ribulose-phosphate 3-epimerase